MASTETHEVSILLLNYNRPQSTKRLVDAINLFAPRGALVYFSVDGPKETRLDDPAKIKNVRDCFLDLDSHFETVAIFRDHNLGLKNNVIDSVSVALSKSRYVIVLEDDCIPSLAFFQFVEANLGILDGIKTGSISGSYFGPQHKMTRRTVFRSKRFGSWGWATSSDVWQRFVESSKAKTLDLGKYRSLVKKDPVFYRYEYHRMFKRIDSLDSWAIPFDFFLRGSGLKTLRLNRNLIENIGFGIDGTHTTSKFSLQLNAYESVSKKQPKKEIKNGGVFDALDSWGRLARIVFSRLRF